jgi:dipeptidyl-peptidase-4
VEEDDAFYLGPSVAWTPDGHGVTYTRLSRDQRHLELRLLEPTLGTDRLLLTESDPHWLNQIGPPLFLPDGTFLWGSERTGRAHLYRYSLEGECLQAVTEGEWQVEAIHGLADGWVYLTGTGEDARERHLYRARTHGDGLERLTPTAGVHDTNFRPGGGWALVTARTPDAPAVSQLLRADGTLHATLREPDPAWAEYDWAQSEFVDVTAEDGTLLHGRLLKPAGFDPTQRYPVVVHVYGGPHAQVVRKSWAGGDPLDQLLTQAGFLVWKLDNRGAWGRGHAFEVPVDRRLGEVELRDQLAGVEYLKSLPYVDPARFGITGWSYGGYLTLYALTHAPEVWRCGVAGAPVTDWKLYDSIYTERYMGTPAENPEGYRAASPLTAAEHLAAPLLLVHGTDDDNVHLQNTLQFVEALSRHRKPYELLVQPQQKHGFTGEAVRTYTHERMVEFFTRHLTG